MQWEQLEREYVAEHDGLERQHLNTLNRHIAPPNPPPTPHPTPRLCELYAERGRVSARVSIGSGHLLL